MLIHVEFCNLSHYGKHLEIGLLIIWGLINNASVICALFVIRITVVRTHFVLLNEMRFVKSDEKLATF